MITAAAVSFLATGAFAIAGGLIGFKKAGSRASLVAGGLSGSLLVTAGILAFLKGDTFSLALGCGVSLLLVMRFLPAFLKTKKVMPAGVMTALTLISLIVGVLAYPS